jgi:hypothetical protein
LPKYKGARVSTAVEIYPAYFFWLGLIPLIATGILYRRRHAGTWTDDLTAGLPLFFMIVLTVSSAVADYGWHLAYTYMVAGGLLFSLLMYGVTGDRPQSRSFKLLVLLNLILVSSTVLAGLSESNLLSPPLLLSLPAMAAVIALSRRRNVSLVVGLLALILGLTGGSVAEGVGGSLFQLTISQDAVWVIIIIAYLVYVSSASENITTSIASISSIPILASIILAGLGASITPLTGIYITLEAGTSGQPIQTLPLILSFAVLGGWAWMGGVGSRRIMPWAGYLTAPLSISLILASATDGGVNGFQTGVARILAPIFGDFANPIIGRVYGLVIALAGLVFLSSTLTYLVKGLDVSRRWSGRQATAAALLTPIYIIAMLDGWRGILPYAGGVNLLLWSIITLTMGLKPVFRAVLAAGIFIYTASTMLWLSLTRLASIQVPEGLYSSATPILGLIASALAVWIVADNVGRLLAQRRSIY